MSSPTDMVVCDLATAAAKCDVSIDTIRRAIRKHQAGLDDGSFPPPLRPKKKGTRGYSILIDDLSDWAHRWPDA